MTPPLCRMIDSTIQPATAVAFRTTSWRSWNASC